MKATYSSRLLSAALVAALVASPAQAFRMSQNNNTGRTLGGFPVGCEDPGGFVHWNIRFIDFFLNESGQGFGKGPMLGAGMAPWTNVPNADHDLFLAGTTNAGFVTDGLNTMLWGTDAECSDADCLAITSLVLDPGQVIVEADVIFNANLNWRTDGGTPDVQAVATHELGHVLGIAHTNVSSSPTPTMYRFYFLGWRTIEADDRQALQCAEARFCLHWTVQGRGFSHGGGRYADITWNRLCKLPATSVDIFRNGVKIVTTANDGAHRDSLVPGSAPANYQVCVAGTGECTNVVSVFFPPILPPV